MSKTPPNDAGGDVQAGFLRNCAGDLVPIAAGRFTARCPVGNLEDYLAAHASDICPALAAGPLRAVNVLVPIHHAGAELLDCLDYLIDQRFDDDRTTGFTFFVNDAVDASEANAFARTALRFIFGADEDAPLPELHKERVHNLRLRAVYEHPHWDVLVHERRVEHGLAEVVQTTVASLLARVMRVADEEFGPDGDRDERGDLIATILESSTLMVCDDDLILSRDEAIVDAHAVVVETDMIGLGRIHLAAVTSGSAKHDDRLRWLMQRYLDLKADAVMSQLAPRIARLDAYHHGPAIELEAPFADQVFFAALAHTRDAHYIDAVTTIVEETYPSNGRFLASLRRHLDGEDVPEATALFQRVLDAWPDEHEGHFTAADVTAIIEALRVRDLDALDALRQS